MNSRNQFISLPIMGLFILILVIQSCRHEEKVIAKPSPYFQMVTKHRNLTNEEFRTPSSSPLEKDSIDTFKGLNYYKIDSSWNVHCELEHIDSAQTIQMATSTERLMEVIPYAYLHFNKNDQKNTLTAYLYGIDSKVLFIPFLDKTNGGDTYGGGRYVEINLPEGNTCTLDFNYAYNPYCAYNHAYSCPIPPLENTLGIEVLAGEMVLYKY